MMRTTILKVIGALGPVLVMAILRTDRRIIRQLMSSCATDSTRAVSLRIPAPFGRWRLRRLVNVGALATPVPGRYFLIDSVWRAYRAQRRRRALTVVSILLLALLLFSPWLR